MTETTEGLALASKAEDALLARDNYPGSAEAEATAAVAYALLAIYDHLANGVVWQRSGDRV